MTVTWKILLCYDGSPESAGGERLLRALRLIPGGVVDVLGVIDPGDASDPLGDQLTSLVGRLAAEGVEARSVVRQGHAAEEILQQAEGTAYDLVATGAHGHRGLTRFLLGSTSGRLARHLSTSLLVSRRPPVVVERVLICTSGEEAALGTLEVGARLASASAAEVTLLHVMSQVALSWESPSEDLADTAATAIARNSREGAHLRKAIDRLRSAGLPADPRPVLRHGLVVDEVLDQLRASRSQLLVIGAHRPPTASAMAPLLDDVADQLLTHAPCSVLIARSTGLPPRS